MPVKVENLTHVYMKDSVFEHVAIDNISFEIQDGEFIGIIGHTGSGKSTLIQHLNGLLKPSSGKVFIDGEELGSKEVQMKKIRQKVGLVFQYPEQQLFEETVYKDVAFGPRNLGLSEDEVEERVRKAIELVGLDFNSISSVSPFKYSLDPSLLQSLHFASIYLAMYHTSSITILFCVLAVCNHCEV
jgi:energy-coupling factor transport system ATP-binding protein